MYYLIVSHKHSQCRLIASADNVHPYYKPLVGNSSSDCSEITYWNMELEVLDYTSQLMSYEF